MADTSNFFTMDGLNRNRQMSGLYAHRPDNSSTYFDYKEIRIPPQFVSILKADVTSVGTNYSKNTTITFPQPEHPSGIAASGYPLFTVSKTSFTVTNPGSNYSPYEYFPIIFDNSEVGSFFITQTGINGSISDYEVVESSFIITTPQSSLPMVDLSSNSTATILSNDKFTISSIDLEVNGLGYQTMHRTTGSGINHNPLISNIGNSGASGLIVESSIFPYIAKDISVHNRKRPPTRNRFEEIQIDQSLTKYMIVKNFSLGDYIS